MDEVKTECMGIHLGYEKLPTLLFADDQVILAEDEQDDECMAKKLIEEYKR